jgi:hypothetical protein
MLELVIDSLAGWNEDTMSVEFVRREVALVDRGVLVALKAINHVIECMNGGDDVRVDLETKFERKTRETSSCSL